MSVRRNVRERKEYIYRRSLKGEQAKEYEKKRAIKKALELGVF
jgi:U3 small nucleolar ribonucleoprotein protein IMP4